MPASRMIYNEGNEYYQKNLADLLALAKQASDAIMEIYDTNTTVVEYKADNSPLTQADKAAHDIIMGGLAEIFPDVPIISEEGSQDENKRLVKSPIVWFIDPIDGTRDFVKRNGEFCIALGLVENSKPVFGLVAAPTFDTVYYGGSEMGSYKIVGDAPAEKIHVKPLDEHIVAISQSHTNEETQEFTKKHWPGAERRRLGSMLKQVKLAEGELDVYPVIGRSMNLWDAAAGNAIIEGAGGYMTRPDGSPLDYSQSDLKIGDFVARATENY